VLPRYTHALCAHDSTRTIAPTTAWQRRHQPPRPCNVARARTRAAAPAGALLPPPVPRSLAPGQPGAPHGFPRGTKAGRQSRRPTENSPHCARSAQLAKPRHESCASTARSDGYYEYFTVTGQILLCLFFKNSHFKWEINLLVPKLSCP